jgi:hypothetical protein
MPRNTTKPEIILGLSISATARSFGIRPERVNDALDAGLLEMRQLGAKKRIPVFGPRGIVEWFNSWAPAQRKGKI